MQALREQVSVASRYVSQQPPPHPVRSSPTRAPRANVPQSRVLNTLAAINMGASPAEARLAHPLLFPHNAGRQQAPSVNPTAVSSPSRGAATLSTPPAMEPLPVPPPALGNTTRARVASAVSSGTGAAMHITPADTKETDPAPEEAPVEEPVPTKPPYSYKDYTPEPIRVYTRSIEEVNDHLPLLRGPLGFDMEWNVDFRRKQSSRPTAVVQICDEKYIWIIQVSVMRKCFPFALRKILENANVPKLGVNIRNDATKLFNDFGVKMQNLIELSYMSRQADKTLRLGGKSHARTLISLQKLVGGYLNKYLAKGSARLSNWEFKLSDEQLEYAANDAHCALRLYKSLLIMAKNDKVELTPDWYTLGVGQNGECVLNKEPPAPVGTTTTTNKKAGKDKDTEITQAPEESVTPTEQANEGGKPKSVRRRALPRPRPSRPSKSPPSPSSSEPSRATTSSWPPHRPSPRKRNKREPDIVEISDHESSADRSIVTDTQTTGVRRSKGGSYSNTSSFSRVPRAAVVDDESPFGEVAFSGRGLKRSYHVGATAAVTASSVTTSSGIALSIRAIGILDALKDD